MTESLTPSAVTLPGSPQPPARSPPPVGRQAARGQAATARVQGAKAPGRSPLTESPPPVAARSSTAPPQQLPLRWTTGAAPPPQQPAGALQCSGAPFLFRRGILKAPAPVLPSSDRRSASSLDVPAGPAPPYDPASALYGSHGYISSILQCKWLQTLMSQSEEDIDEEMEAWAEDGGNKNDADFEDPDVVAAVIAADKEAAAAAKEEEFAADKAAADKAAVEKGNEKVVIDVDADEVKKKREIAKRSDIWKHFTEIKDEDGVVVKGRCKYCNHDIAAHPVNNGKKGDDIGKHLQKVLLDWGLDKIMTVTVDNASANDSGVSYLRRQMNSLKTSITQGKYLHMRCAAHIVNLIVQECLKEILESVKRVRAAVRFVRNGTSRLARFKECAILEKVDTKAFLILDVCTRWNSTYDMLKAACAYEKAFARYAEEDPYFTIELISDNGPGVPDEQDWENARKMAEFLGYFAEITKRVSASLSVTSHTYFHEIGEVNILVNNWLNSSDPMQLAMGKRMKDKFDKYWGQWHDIVENENDKAKGKGKDKDKENINLLIFVAVALDPRYKLSEYTELAIQEIYGESTGEKVWAAVNKGLHGLFEEYRATFAPSDGTPAQSTESESPQSKQGGGSGRMMKTIVAKRMKLNNGSSSSYNRGSRSELEKYLAEECEDDTKKFDILAWWKGQSSRFPILSRLARDVLAIPISTVASESAFSTCGRIMDDFRTSLTPFMVEALVCTQDWLRRCGGTADLIRAKYTCHH
ncbi:hypothetical protein U9M48_007332 [Paspalum notatum var. saurae]|uniref:BED-type domain-containing protein n=1 Tax=Paspalum notatum var. saurae TaxID=547442 RepID=A0AAQ3PUA7_PASNO